MNRRGFLLGAAASAAATVAAPLARLVPAALPVASGLTLAKLLAARELFDQAEAVGPFTMYCSEKQFNQLLASTETGA